MPVKRKDFQKAAALVHEFLLKLSVEPECAELRDALNLSLLHMQRYYRLLRSRHQTLDRTNGTLLAQSLRGLSPMTPFRDTPDKFQWRWLNLSNPKLSGTLPAELNKELSTLPQIITAAKEGDNNALMELIEADPDAVLEVDGFGRTALVYAAHFAHLDTLQMLIDQRIDVNATANDGSTAVHRACHDGHDEVLEILLSCGADASIQDVQGRAPIHWACTTKNQRCLEVLVDHGVNVLVRDKEGMTPSMWACRMDNIEHLGVLEKASQNNHDAGTPLERDDMGKTWLHWSLRRTEPLECLSTLITDDSVLEQDNEGKTVIHAAAEIGSLPAVKLIMEAAGAACLDLRDGQNRTPLMLATVCGHGEVVNYLLSEGADLAAVDNMGATAWDYARGRQLHYCQLILASYIRERGDDDKPEDVDSIYNINDLRINREDDKIVDYQSKPRQPPLAPQPPVTPRGDVNSRVRPKTPATPRAASGLDGPEDQSYPIVPTPKAHTNHYVVTGRDQGGVKRSPSGTESSGDEPAFGRQMRPSVTVTKRRKNEMMSDRGMSVMSMGSIDDSEEHINVQPGDGRTGYAPTNQTSIPQQQQVPYQHQSHQTGRLPEEDEPEMASESHYVERQQQDVPDDKSVESIDNMEVSDFEGGGDGSLADEEGEMEDTGGRRPPPRHHASPPPRSRPHPHPRHHSPPAQPQPHHYTQSRHHQPHPPQPPAAYTTQPLQNSPLYPPPHEYIDGPGEVPEDEKDLPPPEAYHPTPSPRHSRGSPAHVPYSSAPLPSGDQRAAPPPAHLSPLPPASPKKKKKKKKKVPTATLR